MDSNAAQQFPLQESTQEAFQQQVTQPKTSPVVPKQGRFIKILIVLFVIIVAEICGVIIYTSHKPIKVNQNMPKSNAQSNSFSTLPTIQSVKNESQPSLMSTYNNTQYGFQLFYPSKGFAISNTYVPNKLNYSFSFTVDNCGQHIKMEQNVNGSNMDELDIDNFFGISIKSFNGTLNDYIKQNYPSDQYSYMYNPIQGSNADEAVSVSFPSNVVIQHSVPLAMYRKNTKVFTIFTLQNQDTPGACILAGGPTFQQNQWPGLTQQEYTNIYNTFYKNWNIPQSFKFVQ